MPKLLSQNEHSATLWHDQGEDVVIETVTDVEPALERAKALHNAGLNRTQGGDRHVASVPIAVLDAWARKQGLTYMRVMQDQQLLDRFLKDPAHAYFVIDKSAL